VDIMTETIFQNRRAVQIESDSVRVTVLVEGGHIAEILHKPSGVNPLWTPPWPSIEPSTYDPVAHPGYGGDAESKLLAGIMGHNVCIDLFGGPTAEEAAAGVTVHGEASVLPYRIETENGALVARVEMPLSQMAFGREIRLADSGVEIIETVENLGAWDRPIAWTQHVTLGPPFLETGKTRFEANAGRSRTFEGEFGNLFPRGVDFDWPLAPLRDGGTYDLRTFSDRETSAGFTTHLMKDETAYFIATSAGISFGYIWKRADFPWLGIWEENRARQTAPWNGVAITRGMEFGVSPIPESRRQMIERASLFGIPTYRWLPAGGKLAARYAARIGPASGFDIGTLTT
jgi:hypothetical protein